MTISTSVLAGAILPPLGTAGSFGVLGGSAVTNTGPTTVQGDLGVSPGTAVSGFPPGIVMGTIHAGDAVAAQAQNDATTAYNAATGQACDSNLTGQDLGGMTLIPGVYCFDSSAQLTGQLTLNGQGNPKSAFIFKIGSTLTTASNATVLVINGAQPCNIFWQLGSSATIGTNTQFEGNILALTSITLNTGATTSTGLYALNGAVTLDTNTIQACSFVQGPTSTPTPVSTNTATLTSTTTPTTTSTAVPSTATSGPGATNTPVPLATGTSVPVATITPSNTPTRVQRATPVPEATDVPAQTPGIIDTPTPVGTSTLIAQNTPVPTGTNVPGDTATAIALATESTVLTATVIATGTAINEATPTSIAVTPTTAIAIGTSTAAVTITSTPTPIPFLPGTGAGDRWAGPFAALLGVLLLLIGLNIRMLFRKMGKKVGG